MVVESLTKGIFTGGFESLCKNFPPEHVEAVLISDQKLRLTRRAEFKYLPILTVVDWLPNIRTCYHFGRMLDDMADGDLPLPVGFSDFNGLAQHLKEKVFEGGLDTGSGGAVEFLMIRSMEKLIEVGGQTEEVGVTTIDFIEGMRLENERRENHVVLSEEKLYEQFHMSFDPSIDVVLIALGSPLRSREIPELTMAQAFSYSANDWRQDIKVGICNFPLEVLKKAGVSFEEIIRSPGIVLNNEYLSSWLDEMKQKAVVSAREVRGRKVDWKARLMISFLTARI